MPNAWLVSATRKVAVLAFLPLRVGGGSSVDDRVWALLPRRIAATPCSRTLSPELVVPTGVPKLVSKSVMPERVRRPRGRVGLARTHALGISTHPTKGSMKGNISSMFRGALALYAERRHVDDGVERHSLSERGKCCVSQTITQLSTRLLPSIASFVEIRQLRDLCGRDDEHGGGTCKPPSQPPLTSSVSSGLNKAGGCGLSSPSRWLPSDAPESVAGIREVSEIGPAKAERRGASDARDCKLPACADGPGCGRRSTSTTVEWRDARGTEVKGGWG